MPVEAEARKPGTFITNATILSYVKGMQVRHVYLVPSEIHARVAPLVAKYAGQRPHSEPLQRTGDAGGSLCFG